MDCHQTCHLITARLFAHSFNVFSMFIFRKSSKIREVQSHYKCHVARFVEHATNKAICNIQSVKTLSLNITISELMQGQNYLEVNVPLYIGTFWKFVFYQCFKFPSAIRYWNYLLIIKSHPIALPNPHYGWSLHSQKVVCNRIFPSLARKQGKTNFTKCIC